MGEHKEAWTESWASPPAQDRARATRLAFAAGAIAVVVAAYLVPESSSTPSGVRAATSLSYTAPGHWFTVTGPFDPGKTNPILRVAFSTFAWADEPGWCAHAPVTALRMFPDAGALITVYERFDEPLEPLAGFQPKPQRFGPPREAPDAVVEDCLERDVDWSSWFLSVAVDDRAFHVLVVFGGGAPPQVQAEAWSILDSLRAA